MLNFLPQRNKKSVIYEYVLRITSLLLIFTIVVLIFLICFLAPSYFFAKYKNKVVFDQLNTIVSVSIDNKDTSLSTIKDTNAIINILETEDAVPVKRSDLIKTVVNNKGNGIYLTNFSFSGVSGGSLNLTINGIADTRDSLIDFEKNLQKNGTFSSINLPISNIIKDIKTDFTIILKYTKK